MTAFFLVVIMSMIPYDFVIHSNMEKIKLYLVSYRNFVTKNLTNIANSYYRKLNKYADYKDQLTSEQLRLRDSAFRLVLRFYFALIAIFYVNTLLTMTGIAIPLAYAFAVFIPLIVLIFWSEAQSYEMMAVVHEAVFVSYLLIPFALFFNLEEKEDCFVSYIADQLYILLGYGDVEFMNSSKYVA